jgi:hypothetical protein
MSQRALGAQKAKEIFIENIEKINYLSFGI